MKRPGTRQGYDNLLTTIRARVPDVALRTTFIVGFPGETDSDVEQLSAFIDEHRFDHVLRGRDVPDIRRPEPRDLSRARRRGEHRQGEQSGDGRESTPHVSLEAWPLRPCV